MYLDKLKIFGFKSFAKKTIIELTPGITSIVGPNGCGKSNIVDAIRWVLGEQKAGTLRSERMESVIFNGAKDMKPLGMAEVALTIKNTKNVLPVEYTEVVITRRLFRSGESQYLLNNNVCRLKDITDLFMDTGMASNAYSVIELSMVESILSGKPEERRRILEEAAGVTKYKQRRRITFRKLESTESDLVRVQDIISEVESKVNSLRRQVKRAQRYQRLVEELREAEIRAATHKYSSIYSELEPLYKELEQRKRSRESSSAQTSFKEAETESMKTDLIKIEQKLRNSQKELNGVNDLIRQQEEEILVSRERSKSLTDNSSRLQHEIEELQHRIVEQRTKVDSLSKIVAELEQQIEVEETGFEQEEQDFEAVEKDLKFKKEQGKQIENELLRLLDRISQQQASIQHLKATIEHVERRLKELKIDKSQQTERVAEFTAELSQLQKQFEIKNEKLEKLTDEQQEATTRLEEILTERDGLKEEIVKGYSQIETLQHRIGILSKLLESYADYPEGIKYLMVDSNGYLGTVADKISVDEKYRTAIEAILGEAATYMLVGDVDQAFQGIQSLKDNRKGIVTFLPLQQLRARNGKAQKSTIDNSESKIIGWADELIQCDADYNPLVQALTKNFLLVEDLETATTLSKKYSSDPVNYATLTGELITSWGSVKGGKSTHDESGFIGRRDQLDNINKKVDDIQTKMEKAEDRQQKLEQLQKDNQQRRASLEKEISALEKEHADDKLNISQLNYKIAQSEEQNQKIEKEINSLTAELSTANKKINQTSRMLEDDKQFRIEKEESLAICNEEIDSIAADRDKMSQRVNQMRLKLVELNNEWKNIKGERDRSNQIIQDSELSIERKRQERQDNKKQTEDLALRVDDLTESLSTDYTKKETIEADVAKIEEQQLELKEEIDTREKTLRVLRSERESTGEAIHTIELRIAELKLNADNLYRNIGEEYNWDLKRGEIDPEYDLAVDEEQIDLLKQRLKNLGPVNLLALKEYESEKERLDFLQKQHDDLIEAKTNLNNTVDQINQTATDKFTEVFDKIRANFTEVFNRFFKEGIADIKMTDKDDPLETDIEIMANPKSKRPTSLTLLSGGEKALTAISLLFAIYLVKPSPFCILDEVDAPLDDNNVRRFTDALQLFSNDTQFMVVTHNKLTMKAANSLYGITMENSGVSKVVSVKLEQAN